MAGKQNAIHVEGFAFKPGGGLEKFREARHLCFLTCLNFDADALVLRHRQQMINHIKAQGAFGVIDPAQINQLRKSTFRVVAQKLDDRLNHASIGLKCNLAMRDANTRH